MQLSARFLYSENLLRASSYQSHINALWPVSDRYELNCLDLSKVTSAFDDVLTSALFSLGQAIEREWEKCKELGTPNRTRLHDPRLVANILRDIAAQLPEDASRKSVEFRADALEWGYSNEILSALSDLDEEVALIVGNLATWYGKQVGGLPTAFACVRNKSLQTIVDRASKQYRVLPSYLSDLHKDLLLGDPPSFAPCSIMFMAGEGNRHPKHIAYFLPEDEGVKRSPFKKTYYFANTHQALVSRISATLFSRYIGLGTDIDLEDPKFHTIAVLGVLAHEVGHFVYRPSSNFSPLNKVDRWVSVTLQEVAADAFGVLFLAEAWEANVGVSSDDVVAYYIGECLRYIDRGLGFFPDSDGMFLQINYLLNLGALRLVTTPSVRLVGDLCAIIPALRSLGRVLADVLLSGDPNKAMAFYREFGPSNLTHLVPLLEELSLGNSKSIEYLQEHIRPKRKASREAV